MADLSPISIFRKLILKPFYYPVMYFLIAFFNLSFDKNFAGVFTIFLTASFSLYLISKLFPRIFKMHIDINTVSANTGKAFVTGLLYLGIFLTVGWATVSFFSPPGQTITIAGVIDTIADINLGAANSPILQGNFFANLFIGGALIPIIETELFFIAGLQFLAQVFSVPLSLGFNNPILFVLLIVLAGLFTFYHIEAKDVADNVAWALTFLFGLFQGFMVVKFREGESAIHMHMQNNILGILQRAFFQAKTVVGL